MKHRIKVKMIWQVGSMAGWCQSQMAQRFAKSVSIRQGQPNEENPFNNAITDGNPHVFQCDLILADEAAAVDAFATLTAASIIPHLYDTNEVSYVEHHICDHDEDGRTGCFIKHRKEYQNQALSKEIIDGVVQ